MRQVWLAKPVYECLPYVVALAGVLFLALSSAVPDMPNACWSGAVALLIYALVVWLRRLDYRRNQVEYLHPSLDD